MNSLSIPKKILSLTKAEIHRFLWKCIHRIGGIIIAFEAFGLHVYLVIALVTGKIVHL